MSMTKCESVGCHNRVAQHGDHCDECNRSDLSYGVYD